MTSVRGENMNLVALATSASEMYWHTTSTPPITGT